jgi:hypothetical protein
VTCPRDRIAFNPQITVTTGTFNQPPLINHVIVDDIFTIDFDLQSYIFTVDFFGSYPNGATGSVSCFGSGN